MKSRNYIGMKILFFLFICFFKLSIGVSQTTLSGKVTDNTGAPIPFSTVYFPDLNVGAVTDFDGNFSANISIDSKFDSIQVVVSSIGFQKATLLLDVSATESPTDITIVLKNEATSLASVTIESNSEMDIKSLGKITLSSMALLTNPGGNRDPVQSISNLPGNQNNGDLSGLYVRGGDGYEAKIFLEDLNIKSLFFQGTPNIGQRTRLDVELFEQVDFFRNAYSPSYSNSMSGMENMELVSKIPQRSSHELTLSSIGLKYNGLNVSDHSASFYGIRYEDLSLTYKVLPTNKDFTNPPTYTDGYFYHINNINKKSRLKYLMYAGINRVSLVEKDVNYVDVKDGIDITGYSAFGLVSYRSIISDAFVIKISTLFGVSQNKQDVIADRLGKTVFEDHSKSTLYENDTKIKISRYFSNSELEFGFDNVSSIQITDSTVAVDEQPALFAEYKYHVKKMDFSVGSRLDYSTAVNEFNNSPRAGVLYRLSRKNILSSSYSIIYQN